MQRTLEAGARIARYVSNRGTKNDDSRTRCKRSQQELNRGKLVALADDSQVTRHHSRGACLFEHLYLRQILSNLTCAL